MMKELIFGVTLYAGLAAGAAVFEKTVDGAASAPVKVQCREPGAWRIEVAALPSAEKDVGEIEIRLSVDEPAVPPAFSVVLELPQRDIAYFWRSSSTSCGMLPNWGCYERSRLSRQMPLYAYFSESGKNRLTVATDEAKRDVAFWGGLREEGSVLPLGLDFFKEKEPPLKSYSVRVRYDWRDGFYADSIRGASAWITRTAKLAPAAVPDAAFEPLYSSWYCFHQDVQDKDLEAECAIASKLGMKVLIVDDGWQTDDNNRGYAFCGDWQVSRRRFPDMAAHVKKIHALGMKYMVWYSVPFMGTKAANHARFKGKFLEDNKMGAAVLDPRFPEVREFLIGTYERALREWDIDGFKLDFIDSFSGSRENERGGGRDIDTVPEAVDRLMKDVYTRLNAIKPGILIEFRQSYVGQGIRQYGNMMRVGDCPGNYQNNRMGIARLRLTSGETAVHADMLEWHPTEKAEDAARYVLNCLFGTIQYSMMLRTLPPDHLRMIRHWLDFSVAHREALLKGEFRPYRPEHGYPILEGCDATERVIGVYVPGLTAKIPADGRTALVVNATTADSLVLDLGAAPVRIEAFDTFGTSVPVANPGKGLVRIPCPVSGYLRMVQPRVGKK